VAVCHHRVSKRELDPSVVQYGWIVGRRLAVRLSDPFGFSIHLLRHFLGSLIVLLFPFFHAAARLAGRCFRRDLCVDRLPLLVPAAGSRLLFRDTKDGHTLSPAMLILLGLEFLVATFWIPVLAWQLHIIAFSISIATAMAAHAVYAAIHWLADEIEPFEQGSLLLRKLRATAVHTTVETEWVHQGLSADERR